MAVEARDGNYILPALNSARTPKCKHCLGNKELIEQPLEVAREQFGSKPIRRKVKQGRTRTRTAILRMVEVPQPNPDHPQDGRECPDGTRTHQDGGSLIGIRHPIFDRSVFSIYCPARSVNNFGTWTFDDF